ncbi:MAG: arginine--tRNA ligase [Mycoplasmoidaceae bacterium]|nr:MAG: arginine--tRNA ligase [Mycoplasmoidaceae bacterium]
MNDIQLFLQNKFQKAFNSLGFKNNIEIKKSNKEELSDFQCNDALSLAKQYSKNPKEIATNVVNLINETKLFTLTVDGPGFINIKLSNKFLEQYVNKFVKDPLIGFKKIKKPLKVIVDYAGMNVAKTMHIGHLRASIIGEAICRIGRFVGNKIIGDAHLGDWGTPMGVVIAEIQDRMPKLPYFDSKFKGKYPTKCPVTSEQLIEIYPVGANKNKENPEFAKRVQEFTSQLQNKQKGIYDLWKSFQKLSIEDFKKIESQLKVYIDLWYGESDADDAVKFLVKDLDKKGFLENSDGCKIVRINKKYENGDTPPFIMVKSNGTVKYETTDLGTIYNRAKTFKPDKILYVVDKRQSLHFFLVFNAAAQTAICSLDKLEHLGFGTINGPDNKPFKTRSGGVATLQSIIDLVNEEALGVISKSEKANEFSQKQKLELSKKVALASLKFADLINYRVEDYIFTPEKFTSFEGKTGPYILYTAVRIKSIFSKYKSSKDNNICVTNEYEKRLALKINSFGDIINQTWDQRSPNILCAYIYDLAVTYNAFYHNCHILNETNSNVKKSRISLSSLVLKIFNHFAELIGIDIPDKM